VVVGVEKSNEPSTGQKSSPVGQIGASPSTAIDLLGPLRIRRGAAVVALPASRKVRALIAYLALAPRALARSHLCELLWEVPNDPRGELRWCLSKVRALLDEPAVKRVLTLGERVSLELSACHVDVVEVEAAVRGGLACLSRERLSQLAALFGGEFLEGLEWRSAGAFAPAAWPSSNTSSQHCRRGRPRFSLHSIAGSSSHLWTAGHTSCCSGHSPAKGACARAWNI
jgi:hypothetical protein